MGTSIILASTSPRRREILSQAGVRFEVVPVDVSEELDSDSDIGEAVASLALRKALSVSASYPDSLIIGADTVVVLDGRILGKPRDADDAQAMLSSLSGRTHTVITGVAVTSGDRQLCDAEYTEVTFRDLSEREIANYITTGEPFDKAGAYGIQGKGALLVSGIRGCYLNVVGLPLTKLSSLLAEFDIAIDAFW